jgi:uncharacterized protein YndB with AHSA1/START domain
MTSTMDRIEKKVTLHAPLARVWRAISDAKEFGLWFGMELDAPFVAGTTVTGRIAPTTVDAEVAKQQQPHAGVPVRLYVERVEPMSLLSFRWHPGAVEPGLDLSKAPSTLVSFALEKRAGETLLTITESGFDAIPLDRRAKIFAGNEAGWSAQTRLIAQYLAQAS